MKTLTALFVLAVAFIAAAPAEAAGPAGRVAPGMSLTGGFSNLTWDGCCAPGFFVNLTRTIGAPAQRDGDREMRLVVDFGRQHWTFENDLTLVAGPRWQFDRAGDVDFFAEVTAGLIRYTTMNNSGNYFMFGGGGGVLYHINDRLGVSGQFDLWGKQHNGFDLITRLAVGVVVDLGQK